MDNKQIENRSYLFNVKRYIEQVQTIYRIGVCVPAILSPWNSSNRTYQTFCKL